MNVRTLIFMIFVAFILAACGGGSTSNVSAPQSSAVPTTTNVGQPSTTSNNVTEVTISGKITFDNVPHKTSGFGLDYHAIVQAPARGIVVKLVNAANETVEQVITDHNGQYTFKVEPAVEFKIQAAAHLLSPVDRDWDVRVTDNTANNALYVLAGALQSSGNASSQIRDLHAPSGWNGTSYASERAAAPFAILNSVYTAIKAVDAIDQKASFPELEIRWSPNNRAAIGNKAAGNIATSGFHREDNVIYLLGEAGRDTDEYDPHVIVHEWGHYFEHNLSRLDSIAGLHSLSAKLDPRLAFSEGWGNALAAIVTGDPQYKDSSGLSQSSGLNIDFETIDRTNKGWFSEASVSALIYDVFDNAKDENDNLSVGFGPIYEAMTDVNLRGGEAFVTIFSFSEALLRQSGINQTDYNSLLEGQSITASNALAKGEENNGSIATALPVYKEAQIDGGSIRVCSVDDAGNYNRLGNREFVVFDVPQDGNYTISMHVVSGGEVRDPDFNLWREGQMLIESDSKGDESYSGHLKSGRYVAETYDFFNINGTSDKRGDGCFNFAVSTG